MLTESREMPTNVGETQGSSDLSPESYIRVFGVELFDLCIIVSLGMYFLLGVPLDQLLLHPMTKFIAAVGYFASLYYLGRTRTYHEGFQQIKGVHSYLHFSTLLGGLFSGMIVCLFILLPLSDLGRKVGIGEDWMTLILLPLGLFCAFLVPHLSSRISENEDVNYISCPRWFHWAGRGFILLTANILLLHVYSLMKGELEEDLLMRSILASFMMAMFYVPVRVQEMFLQPNGAHFSSLFRTTVAVILCGTAPAWLQQLLY